MASNSVEKLIKLFSKFPTVGPRTAARFVFYLLRLSKEELNELTNSINELKDKVKLCKSCFNAFEGDSELCDICQNQNRDKSLLCIVEKETDLETIEKTKKYNGYYFVLGGTVSAVKKEDVEKLRIKELEERIKDNEIKEIIIAINPTPDGEATSLYLERLISKYNKKATKLGKGLPVGGEIEYADDETIASAFEGRK